MRRNDQRLLKDLLKAVSRSFYLTLRALPSAVRPQIGLAYLLARATDTVADTELIPVPSRLHALSGLGERISGKGHPIDFSDIAAAQPRRSADNSDAERALLLRVEDAIALLHTFSEPDQELIRQVLIIIVSGQRLDLQRFGAASVDKHVLFLNTDAELDDYTYRVAGCVGEFWTKMCRAHLFPDAEIDEASLLDDAVRFGKGLQLVNILRDLPRDLLQGRCYIPAENLSQVGLQPGDLLNAAAEDKFRPVYNQLLARAWSHLEAGWRYTNKLPRSCVRVRLACAWPILIGAQTIRRLGATSVLDSTRRVKISRADVRRILASSVLLYPSQRRWRALFQ